MNTKVIDYTNFTKEHICCVLRDRKGEGRIDAKRKWMENVFEDGLVIRKGDVDAKVFIEYIPAEYAWCPVDAPGYMFVHCFRVDERYKHTYFERDVWREVIAESRIKHKRGLCVLVGTEDMPYLNKKDDLEYRGFRYADEAPPYFELFYMPFDLADEDIPTFIKNSKKSIENGFVLYYSHQCPHTAKAVPLLEAKAKELGIEFTVHKLESYKDAKAVPCPYTAFALFYNKKFVTHEIMSPSKFAQLVKELTADPPKKAPAKKGAKAGARARAKNGTKTTGK